MRRFLPLMLIFALTSPMAPWARAEDTPNAQELHELRRVIDQQSKQIEVLAEQVGRLTRVIEGQKAAATEPAAAKPPEPASAPTATTSVEPAKPAPEASSESPKAEAVPKSEAGAGPGKHVVAKGETLTSIAKHYNIPLADLKSVNKIDNERRLQIGQILTVPTAKNPDTNEKKENP